MKTILVVSRNGICSSIILKYKIEKILSELNISTYQINHCKLDNIENHKMDLVVTSANLSNHIQSKPGMSIIGLENVMDDRELKTEFLKWLNDLTIFS